MRPFSPKRVELPPLKIYRGFPELNNFTPDDCHLFYLQARIQSKRRRLKLLILWGGFTYVALSAVFVAGIVAVLQRLPQQRRFDWVVDLSVVLLVGVYTACLLPAAFKISRSVMRIVIRLRLRDPHCSCCGYALSGLPAPLGHVRCPECGSDELVTPTTSESPAGG